MAAVVRGSDRWCERFLNVVNGVNNAVSVCSE
jgi:hypothetical protein